MDDSVKVYNYIASQCQTDEADRGVAGFVTISRQAGAGGISIGEKLAAFLNKKLPERCPWTVFDKTLVDEIIKDNHLSQRLLPFFKETRLSAIEDALEDLFGVHPPQSTLVEKTNQTILHLARKGRVILVGRGAPVITRFTQGGVHVRLVAPLEDRRKRIQEYCQLTEKEAVAFIAKEDSGRALYLKEYFNKDIEDPLLYDLVINTACVGYEGAVALIGGLVLKKIKVA